jgi:hypothetical protein
MARGYRSVQICPPKASINTKKYYLANWRIYET